MLKNQVPNPAEIGEENLSNIFNEIKDKMCSCENCLGDPNNQLKMVCINTQTGSKDLYSFTFEELRKAYQKELIAIIDEVNYYNPITLAKALQDRDKKAKETKPKQNIFEDLKSALYRAFETPRQDDQASNLDRAFEGILKDIRRRHMN